MVKLGVARWREIYSKKMSECEIDHEITVETTNPLVEVSEDRVKGRRPREPWRGETVQSIVYGGLDAIVTCFSLISSISATHLSSDVLVLGIANLVADGISQAIGDFLSSNTKKELTLKEREVTEWDVINHRRDQQQQLLQQYQKLGMDIDDANTVVNIFAKYDDILVDQKMTTQKGMLASDKGGEKPCKNGVVTFMAFVGFGSAPILSFIILKPFTDNELVMFIGACFMSALGLAVLGIARAKIAGKNYFLSISIVLLNGAVAAAAAYFLGWMLRNVAGVEVPIMTKVE